MQEKQNDQYLAHLADEQATLAFGARLAQLSSAPFIYYLEGNLGAGKTTLARGLIQSLGHKGKVKSPTYNLVEEYRLNEITILHFDLYRLQDPQELEYIGIQDYFAQSAISLIEWPAKGKGWVPPADVIVYLESKNEARQIKLVAHSPLGKQLICNLSSTHSV